MVEKSEVSKNRVERLLEIQKRLELLSEQDQVILANLPRDPSAIIDAIKISADNFILPRKVIDSLEKLQELSFISEVETGNPKQPHRVLAISKNGTDAQIILPLMK
jgi:hypothetical protein